MSLSLVSSAHLWKLIKQFPNTFIIHHWFPPTLSCSALCGNGFLYKSGNGKKRKVSIPWNYIDSGNSTENNFFFCFQRNRRSSSKSRTSGGSCLETDQSFIFFANSPFCNSKHCSLQSRSFRVKGWRSFPIKVFKTEVAEEPANSFHYSFTLICLMAFDQSSKPIQAEECQVRSSISFFRPINAKRLQLVEITYLKFTINLQICILFVSRWPVISERPCKQSIVQVRIKQQKTFSLEKQRAKKAICNFSVAFETTLLYTLQLNQFSIFGHNGVTSQSNWKRCFLDFILQQKTCLVNSHFLRCCTVARETYWPIFWCKSCLHVFLK